MSKEWNFDSSFVDKTKLSEPEFALSRNLEKISMSELRDIKDKVNFYLEHFNILNKKQVKETTDIKISLLRKLRYMLDGELKTRVSEVSIL